MADEEEVSAIESAIETCLGDENTSDSEEEESLKCTDSSCSSEMAAMAAAMGMDETCQKAASTAYDVAQTTVDIDVSASMGWGLAKYNGSANMNTFKESMDSSMSESGCQSISLNMSKIVNAQTNISCAINSQKVETDLSASASASVSVKTLDLTEIDKEIIENGTTKYYAFLVNLAALGATGDVNEEYLLSLQASADETQAALIASANRDINIGNSTIEASANSKITSSISNTASVAASVESDYQAIAETVAETSIASSLGVDALSDAQRSAVTNEVSNELTNASTSINELLTKTTMTVQADGSVEIESNGAINIYNTTLSANALVDITTSAISQSAVNAGSVAATTIMNKITSDTDMYTESDGLGELQDSINEGLEIAGENAQDSVEDTSSGNSTAMIVIGIVLVVMVIGGVVAAYFASKTAADPNVAKNIAAAKGMGFGGPMKGSNFSNPMATMYKYVGLVILLLIIIAIVYMAIKWNNMKKSLNPTNWF